MVEPFSYDKDGRERDGDQAGGILGAWRTSRLGKTGITTAVAVKISKQSIARPGNTCARMAV
jgi:hypothetical protein